MNALIYEFLNEWVLFQTFPELEGHAQQMQEGLGSFQMSAFYILNIVFYLKKLDQFLNDCKPIKNPMSQKVCARLPIIT